MRHRKHWLYQAFTWESQGQPDCPLQGRLCPPGTHDWYSLGPSYSPPALHFSIPVWRSQALGFVTWLSLAGVPKGGCSYSYLILCLSSKAPSYRAPKSGSCGYLGWVDPPDCHRAARGQQTHSSLARSAVLATGLSPTGCSRFGHPLLLLVVLPKQLSLLALQGQGPCLSPPKNPVQGVQGKGPVVLVVVGHPTGC